VVDLFNTVDVGAKVVITKDRLPKGSTEKPAEPGEAVAPADDAGSASAPPIEIDKIVPTDGEKKRAEENAEKAKETDAKPRSKKPAKVPLFRSRPADKPDAYTTLSGAATKAKI
jgi:lipoprotein-anchoring transpeptidase ErfK/SrfK